MYDYRELQGKADARQKQIEEITARGESQTDADRDRVMELMGEIKALEEAAGELRDAEVAELRDMVARATAVPGAADPRNQEVADFRAYMRTGEIRDASMSTTDANGGYLVPEPRHADVVELVRKVNPIFGQATVFDMKGGDTTMQLPYKSAHGVATTATETGARSEQSAPTFTSPSLTCYEYYSDQRATQTYLDSVEGSEDQLVQWMYEDVFEQAEYDATVGDGSTKIKGLFACTSEYTAVLSGAANALANTAFPSTYFSLPIKYRRNAKWVMASATLATVSTYAWPNLTSVSLAKMNENTGEWTIMGKPVLESDSAPSVGDGAYPVAFGDIAAGYAVGVHRNTSILRDPYTAPPKIRFYALARLGGCAWDYQAVRLLKSDDA